MTLRFTGHTLGSLLETLEALGDSLVERLDTPHSYRGDYAELAFEVHEDKVPASEAHAIVTAAHGGKFEGYKGGWYSYDIFTPVWAATQGTSIDSGRLGGPTIDGQWVVVEEVT